MTHDTPTPAPTADETPLGTEDFEAQDALLDQLREKV